MATRQDTTRQPRIPKELKTLRRSIDNLDTALICLLAERFAVTERVGHLKAELALPAADPGREARQLARIRALAKTSGLDPEVAEQVLTLILRSVVRRHKHIAKG